MRKSFIFFLPLCFYFIACSPFQSQSKKGIGEIVNGKIVMAIDLSETKTVWEDFLAQRASINVSFDNVKIEKINKLY